MWVRSLLSQHRRKERVATHSDVFPFSSTHSFIINKSSFFTTHQHVAGRYLVCRFN